MQYRPDAPTLLGAVAEVLDDVLADIPAAKQHAVRVAAHLTRLVEREVRLGGEATDDERAALRELLGVGPPADLDGVGEGNERLAAMLRNDEMDDAEFARVWRELVDVTRRDLAIAKPGHADWVGT